MTKIHARSDGEGRPLGFVLTGDETSDYRGVDDLLKLPVNKPQIMADKGFDSDEVRSALLMKGIGPVIPPRANRKDPPVCDFKAYKDRNQIERMFGRLKQFRRIATRYDSCDFGPWHQFIDLAHGPTIDEAEAVEPGDYQR